MTRSATLFFAIVAFLLMSDCANMKGPSGGPKDIYPPIVEESEPPNYSTFFTSQKIVLKFDEFVVVSDVVSEVFISPPLQNTPDIKVKGKTVVITIDEELQDSTTYSIFFGNAIKDNTEGNPLENYTYVFSTGGYIDSLSIVGEVTDAFELKPREAILIMLYEDDNDTIVFDSLPYFVKPSYVTRTSEEGYFVINNISDGEYALYALSDNNMSATYDNAEEEVAFLDSLISPVYLVPVLRDSLFSDSLAVADSLPPDLPLEEFYTLFLFQEGDTVQRLLDTEKTRQRVLRFIFRYPAKNIKIEPLTPVTDAWMKQEWSTNFDTLRYYIMNENLDTISLKISLGEIVFDTVSYSLNEEILPLRKKERQIEKILKISGSKQKLFPHHKNFFLTTGYPIIDYDFSRFLLVEGEDTLQPELSIYGEAGRKIRLDYEFKEKTPYTLFLPDSVLTDLLGRSNDTTYFNFTTNEYEDYGLYNIHVVNNSPYEQLIIQLLTVDEKILRNEFIQTEGSIAWDYLKPGKYMIKANADLNLNGEWDTGNFSERLQPEPVVYYKELIVVREGWSFDLDWAVSFE